MPAILPRPGLVGGTMPPGHYRITGARRNETRVGTVDLKIPKLRSGSYFPWFPGVPTRGLKGNHGRGPGVHSRHSIRSLDELVPWA